MTITLLTKKTGDIGLENLKKKIRDTNKNSSVFNEKKTYLQSEIPSFSLRIIFCSQSHQICLIKSDIKYKITHCF